MGHKPQILTLVSFNELKRKAKKKSASFIAIFIPIEANDKNGNNDEMARNFSTRQRGGSLVLSLPGET